MTLKKCNTSYYDYRASFKVWKKDHTADVITVSRHTDILHSRLHFWNRKCLYCKYKNMLVEEIIHKEQAVMWELLEEEFILIPKFTYMFSD